MPNYLEQAESVQQIGSKELLLLLLVLDLLYINKIS